MLNFPSRAYPEALLGTSGDPRFRTLGGSVAFSNRLKFTRQYCRDALVTGMYDGVIGISRSRARRTPVKFL